MNEQLPVLPILRVPSSEGLVQTSKAVKGGIAGKVVLQVCGSEAIKGFVGDKQNFELNLAT